MKRWTRSSESNLVLPRAAPTQRAHALNSARVPLTIFFFFTMPVEFLCQNVPIALTQTLGSLPKKIQTWARPGLRARVRFLDATKRN